MIEIAAPPEVSRGESSRNLIRLLPLVTAVATLGIVGASLISGTPVARNPTILAFPVMMLCSALVAAVAGRSRSHGIGADRADYLGYLSDLRQTVTATAEAQRSSLNWAHPDPDALWTLIGGPRMWERGPDDPNFGEVRVGIATVPLATALRAPELPPPHRSDPVTVTALQRFLHAHSTVAGVPIAIPVPGTVTIDGDAPRVRGLLRAMICQLAVLHAPDQIHIAAVIDDSNRAHWDWLKWLPHTQSAVAEASAPLVVVVVDSAECAPPQLPAACCLVVGAPCDDAPLIVRYADAVAPVERPDEMDLCDALVCARLLAAHRTFDSDEVRRRHSGDRLRVAIGTATDGRPVELDIKEPAEHGMGPHGLCVGATGSGKSELLRTVALGMMLGNSPEVVNLLLIDFKGGATFLDLARAPHVAAVITNLAEEAPLVARMRDALAGEMNRRQQVLRAAGNLVSVAAYEQARRSGAELSALPTLFIIVDEFSELLSQHPDFADVFVAIGRLGRSLGMHLLLASQRLDEGRLRGLEAHLSYRICLKTLSTNESRAVLGTLDAYELPNTPGAGLLWVPSGELTRFQGAHVSQALARWVGPRAAAPTSVRRFTMYDHSGRTSTQPGSDVVHEVLDRLCGQGSPAHQLWLPPLGEPPALAHLLRDSDCAALSVPVGIVDRPFEQTRTPLTVDLSGATGNVAVVGAPRTGKSTALCTLVTALAVTHDPCRVQFYCLDFGGGQLDSVRELPHVGAVAGRAEPELVWRIAAEVESILRTREASDASGDGDVFLVIDGWSALCHEFGALEESITAIAVQGLSHGIHIVVSASRWAEIRPALKDQIGTRIELRLGDPADSEVDRKQARQVPRNQPGRGLSPEGLHMMIALPRSDGLEPRRGNGEVAPPIPLLPEQVDLATVVQQAGDDVGAYLLLGLDERRLSPVAVDVEHLLILGDTGCGKTSALRMLCHEIVRARSPAQLFVVDFRRGLLGVVDSEHLGGYAMSPAALSALMPSLLSLLQARIPPADVSQAQLRARSWWSGPDVYLVVDDYDLVAGAAVNPLLGLLEYLPHARDLGLHVVVSRRSGGAARALFEPLLAALRDLGCMGLMMSARPDEGALLGASRPRSRPPGRGVLVSRSGDEQLVQLAWCPPP